MHTNSIPFVTSLLAAFVLLGASCSQADDVAAIGDDGAERVLESSEVDLPHGADEDAVDHGTGEDGDGPETPESDPAGGEDGHGPEDNGQPAEDEAHDATGEAAADGVDLVIPVEMNEWGYAVSHSIIPAGSTVRFDFVNVGVVEHEAMFGDAHLQEEFAEATEHGEHGDDGHHGDVDAITLDPGEEGSIVVSFDEPGEVLIGCHLPGHWAAGMVATLEVAP
ncbi:MAG: hypothetical protein OER95_00690 [Acidimicrobiia bacterium]|nr:hypothetical protein [Acidimicrobiia bacterium]